MSSGERIGDLNSSEELSEVGTPLDAAQQALKEKYEQAEKAKSGSAGDDEGEGRSGLDDAKAMLKDEFEGAKKGLSGKHHASQPNEVAREHDEAAGGLVRSAQEKLGSDEQRAPDESLGQIDQAKRQIAR
ncbi:hypothetical protein SELMODRAFT_420684 [Selaginella moellendorffii]|uniref:Uncharacterized protein n=1 Tax=Selaginella moellendorffii TaxID=88036 RepID=D8SCS9_SELML|nr:28 kDa heat- and acid-stable phosphoprotein [Selaginella moellendorffii]XP_002982678.1 28 kDa heat- and acid-stable phosphoprotein [Selaginella moellendorffii]EFJ16431.1 hypothetical protein SELMODRAFT_421982 [Selaginella moellendorffii]EFJ17906.1 hypothetical protein SELMODRAFT_420684 [Selaginella moellendorffii]|eukprot:XP_002981205.1 28 kDa heat- and acid-stable phosphoprotein [Selaginella moellendorffii]